MTSNVKLLPLPEPKFGEWLRGIYASESNPNRDGMYVRTIRRTGRLNPGVHYEVTDGNGKFWQYPAQSAERLATPPRIWLQIDTSADNSERDDKWPDPDGVSWCWESIGGLEIQYVRADLAQQPAAVGVKDGR